jgi:hypothetical protein
MSKGRRYYLHNKLRRFVKIDASDKKVNVGSTFLYLEATEKQKEYLKELSSLGYEVQIYID